MSINVPPNVPTALTIHPVDTKSTNNNIYNKILTTTIMKRNKLHTYSHAFICVFQRKSQMVGITCDTKSQEKVYSNFFLVFVKFFFLLYIIHVIF